MEAEYWLKRWQEGRVGFHQGDVNRWLEELGPALLQHGTRVFVPLCGKSIDLAWIRQQGAKVYGVELSRAALEAFFDEQGVSYETFGDAPFTVFEADHLRLYQGDFFALDPDRVGGPFDLVYDRAALIALPQDMRQRYAESLLDYLKPEGRILLLTLNYPQAQIDGPPHAVPWHEVHALFGHACEIHQVASEPAFERGPARFREANLNFFQQDIYVLTKR